MPMFTFEEEVLKFCTMRDQAYPYGHILLCSSNPQDRFPAYWGHVVMRAHDRKAEFWFIINGFSAQQYIISLFSSADFLNCFLSVRIHADAGLLHLLHIHTLEQSVAWIPDEFIEFVHLLITASTQILPAIYQQNAVIDARSYMWSGYCVSFGDEFIKEIEEKITVPFDSLVTSINLVLG
jgi:hypothetical protein